MAHKGSKGWAECRGQRQYQETARLQWAHRGGMFCKAAGVLGESFHTGKDQVGTVRGWGWGEPGAAQGAWGGEAEGHTDEGHGELFGE